jgi:hypothetical protein
MRERGRVEKEHNGVIYTHVTMYHNESDAEEEAKRLHENGKMTWIEKGGSDEYYPYHVYSR